MLVVSVARQLRWGNSFGRLLCCPLKPRGVGRRRSESVKLTMRPHRRAGERMKPQIHDASARQHSGELFSGLSPNDARDRLCNPDLAEVDGEIAGLAARSAQELQRAWRILHHTARVSRIAPPRFRGIGAVSRSSRGRPSPTYQTSTPWSAPARTASKCISIDKARSTTSFRFSSSCR